MVREAGQVRYALPWRPVLSIPVGLLLQVHSVPGPLHQEMQTGKIRWVQQRLSACLWCKFRPLDHILMSLQWPATNMKRPKPRMTILGVSQIWFDVEADRLCTFRFRFGWLSAHSLNILTKDTRPQLSAWLLPRSSPGIIEAEKSYTQTVTNRGEH